MSESKGFLARLREFERPKSPKVIRRLEQVKPVVPVPEPKPDISKITQTEVEEKLKQMRQKRLSRLNIHVDEQSKLSETRSLCKITDTDDDESTSTSNHKTVLDINDHTRSLDRSYQDATKKSSSSTKKFINKFSCMSQDVSTSAEELSKETYVQPLRKSLPNRLDTNKMQQVAARKNSSDEEIFIRHSLVRSSSKSINGSIDRGSINSFSENRDSSDYTMNIFSNEFKNNPPDDQYPSRTVTYETFGKSPSIPSTPKISEAEANFLDDEVKHQDTDSDDKLTENRDEQTNGAKVMAEKQSILLNQVREFHKNQIEKLSEVNDSQMNKAQIGKKNQELEMESVVKVSERKKSTPQEVFTKTETEEITGNEKNSISVGKCQQFYENFALEKNAREDLKQYNIISKLTVPRSPLPLPRKNTKEERLLKQFQASLVTLTDIQKNESMVDSDEIEAFKHTLEDITAIVDDYKYKLNNLEVKFIPREKLRKIRLQLEDVKSQVKSFKGLKRDVSYLELSNRLSTYYFDLKNHTNFNDLEVIEERKVLLDEVNRCVSELEAKVERNEETLRKILEEQVLLIQSHRIVPTVV